MGRHWPLKLQIGIEGWQRRLLWRSVLLWHCVLLQPPGCLLGFAGFYGHNQPPQHECPQTVSFRLCRRRTWVPVAAIAQAAFVVARAAFAVTFAYRGADAVSAFEARLPRTPMHAPREGDTLPLQRAACAP